MDESHGNDKAACLAMRGISKRFGATTALDDVSLDIQAGQVHALVGENGAGKSTLMKILSGAIASNAGTMELKGLTYRPENPAQARRRGVSMIYQELSIAPDLSVADNIVLGAEPHLGPLIRPWQVRRCAADALALLDCSDIDLAGRAGDLSAAQQQLVEIARNLAIGSSVLVFDEPTSSLPHNDVDQLLKVIRRLRDQGRAIVYISHILEEIRQIADVVTVLRDGRRVDHGRVEQMTSSRIVEKMVGRSVEQLYPRSERAPGAVLLNMQDLAGEERPKSASLQLRRGEVFGIAGIVGAGRSEMLRSIFGLDAIRAGQITLKTFPGAHSPTCRWQQGAGMVSEERKDEGLAVNLSVAENLTMPKLPWITTPKRRASASSRWIEKLAIKCFSPSQPIDSLSGGNQQKVAVARLLEADCDVWLLDEPTRGIDVGSKAQIYQLIDDLACGADGREPRAVLIVSSYLPELLGVCDRIAVMCQGRLGPARAVEDCSETMIIAEATVA